jgi:hypothetical protein
MLYLLAIDRCEWLGSEVFGFTSRARVSGKCRKKIPSERPDKTEKFVTGNLWETNIKM